MTIKSDHNIDYTRWVIEGKCAPQVAACLILGVHPDECIVKDAIDWRNTRFIVKEVEELTLKLCEGSALWWHYQDRSIFEHLEIALKIRVEIVPAFLDEVKKVFSNYVAKDQKHFIEKHPYIAKNLNLVSSVFAKSETLATPQNEFSETERSKVLQMLLGMAIDKYDYNPSSDRNVATGGNHGSIKASLESLGMSVNEDTIRKYLTEAAKMFPNVKSR